MLLGAPHAVAAVVAEVAVAVANRDRPAVVARRGIDLKLCKLALTVGRTGIWIHLHLEAGSLQKRGGRIPSHRLAGCC